MLHRKKFSDIKSLINLSLVRLNAVRKKNLDDLAHRKRLLAKALQEHEFASARLEAERIVKVDWKIESLNLLEIKAEEVRDNVTLLQNQKEVPYDLDEAVSTLIYCNERSQIPELNDVVKVLQRKYGKEYVDLQRNNSTKRVDERLVHRLSGQRPNAFLVYNYMKEIAKSFNIDWVEDEVTKAMGQRFDVPMSAGAPGVGSASGLGSAAYAVTDGTILPKGQKPKGFVPPALPDETELVGKQAGEMVETEVQEKEVETTKKEQTVETEATLPPKPAASAKQKPQQNQQTKSKPTTAPSSGGGMSDLEARFAKLRDL